MKLPKKLKIGGHVFKVEYVKRDNITSKIYDKDNCGLCDIKANVLYIDLNQADDQIEETIIHEVFHAINGTMDHTLLHQFAHAWHQVLRDNKLLK